MPYDELALFHENAEEFGLPWRGTPDIRRVAVDVGADQSVRALVWVSSSPELVAPRRSAERAHWDTVALALDRPLVVYATYSFKFGGNGPDILKLCRNNWDLIFGNDPQADSFGVTMVTDDRSRIKDLGSHHWQEMFRVPRLAAYEEPASEEGVKAIEGHIYFVHSRDTGDNHYALFRVEKLTPGESVEITWKLIPPPARYGTIMNAAPKDRAANKPTP